ncbi:MAG: sulfurtransferase [Burkholderiaceae bacterium]|nr:sulfurtransferase [Burkholderiaceae bacterium]
MSDSARRAGVATPPAPDSNLLVSPDWLHGQVGAPGLSIIDARAPISPDRVGPPVYLNVGTETAGARIPWARYIHLVDDLSDPDGSFPIALARPPAVAQVLSAHGISADDTIVVYGGAQELATHRVWWALKASGARDVRVLDGGIERWVHEGRPLQAEHDHVEPRSFCATRRPEMLAARDDVLAAIDDPRVCLVNALTAAQHHSRTDLTYGRPGRIPASCNISARDLIDPDSGRFLPLSSLRSRFERERVLEHDRCIVYCGGGIAATTVVLGLWLIGYRAVAMYDGSLREWARDPRLPMEVG